MTSLHVVAGLLSLVAGGFALYSLKGGTLHRKAGRVFAYAMLLMSGSGALMAAMKPTRISVIGGLLAFYLVTTGLLTVLRRPGEPFSWLDRAAMLLAFVVGIAGIKFGFDALANANGRLDQFPAQMYFIFGGIALLAASLDLRMLVAGDILGAHRLARHLWRMGLALWIATGSFFLGQAKVFPEALRKPLLLAIPVVLVAVTVLYWLVRILRQRRARAPFRRTASVAPQQETRAAL